MKIIDKFISVFLVCFLLVFFGCMAEEPAPSEENNSLPSIESEVPSDSESECRELLSINVLGDENAFFVHYAFIDNEGVENQLMIRVHKLESGEFALVARGGGPIGFGLEKTDITLEDITD